MGVLSPSYQKRVGKGQKGTLELDYRITGRPAELLENKGEVVDTLCVCEELSSNILGVLESGDSEFEEAI